MGPPPQTLARPWVRPERPPDTPRSRWKAGATTFGPAGRVVGTFLVLGMILALAGLYSWTGPMAVVFLPAAVVAALPFLRALWRKDRVV